MHNQHNQWIKSQLELVPCSSSLHLLNPFPCNIPPGCPADAFEKRGEDGEGIIYKILPVKSHKYHQISLVIPGHAGKCWAKIRQPVVALLSDVARHPGRGTNSPPGASSLVFITLASWYPRMEIGRIPGISSRMASHVFYLSWLSHISIYYR